MTEISLFCKILSTVRALLRLASQKEVRSVRTFSAQNSFFGFLSLATAAEEHHPQSRGSGGGKGEEEEEEQGDTPPHTPPLVWNGREGIHQTKVFLSKA